MAEIIKPEEVREALVAVPPKLSALTKPLAFPEEQFEEAVKDATGFTLPPGPCSMLITLQQTIEGIVPASPLPFGKEKKGELTPRKREVETAPRKRKFEVK